MARQIIAVGKVLKDRRRLEHPLDPHAVAVVALRVAVGLDQRQSFAPEHRAVGQGKPFGAHAQVGVRFPLVWLSHHDPF